MVTPKGEARTAGIVYTVHDHKLYIGSYQETWKVKHIRQNPHVSLTVTIAKRVPFLPWIKVPAVTITFAGEARALDTRVADPVVLKALYRDVVKDEKAMAASCVIEIVPWRFYHLWRRHSFAADALPRTKRVAVLRSRPLNERLK